MLRPQDTSTRERKNLNGLWQFSLDPEGRGRSDRWFSAPLAEPREMAVPASFNDIAADAAVRDYFGDVWYQRTVWVPKGWQGQRWCCTSSQRPIERPCGSTTSRRSPTKVATRRSRPTSPPTSTPGGQVRITACVNNTLNFQSIPPGVIEDTPAGKRQRYWHDFFNYAGIHRSVWLYATDTAHLIDVTVVTELDGDAGLVDYTTEAEARRNRADPGRPPRCRGRGGRSRHRGQRPLTVANVHPWAPGDGYLYDLEIQLVRDGVVVDSYHQSVGVRTVKVDGIRFLINGEPF